MNTGPFALKFRKNDVNICGNIETKFHEGEEGMTSCFNRPKTFLSCIFFTFLTLTYRPSYLTPMRLCIYKINRMYIVQWLYIAGT